jgi:hypothetical protein
MKKLLILPLLLLSIGFLSCQKENANDPALTSQNNILNTDKPGFLNPGVFVFSTCNDWRISLFKKGKYDLSSYFEGVTLNFCPDNSVVISNDIFSVAGNWYFIGNKGKPTSLVLDFNFPVVLTEGTRPNIGYWAEIEGIWLVKIQNNVIGLQINDLISDNGIPVKNMVIERH